MNKSNSRRKNSIIVPFAVSCLSSSFLTIARLPMLLCMILVLKTNFIINDGSISSSGNNNMVVAFAFTKIPKSIADERYKCHGRPFSTKIVLKKSVKWNQEVIESDDAPTGDLKINQGRFLLGLVALLYGTLNVCLRFVYDVPDIPPTAAALSASRGWIALVCFLPPLLLDDREKKGNEKVDISSKNSSSLPLLLKSGMELAVWNFLAQGLLNVGLITTGSARASFLTQCSVLFTPIISTLIGKQFVAQRVWFGCFIALFGLITLTMGGGGASSALFSLSLSSGDAFVIGGALSWSMYLFRVSILGPKHSNDEIRLQGVKTGFVAVLYSIWWLISSIMNATGLEKDIGFMQLFGSIPSWMISSYVVWIALLFSAIGPGTCADILQQKGQSVVTASEANVILSAEPVFATLFAVFLLGEKTSVLEIIGGGLILCAALIASTKERKKE